MASALCRSKFLTNLYVQKATVLDIREMKHNGTNHNNEWTYVILATWSDGREAKVYREYGEISILHNFISKLRQSEKLAKVKSYVHIPKVPGRGFFDWSLIKFMIKNQAKVDHFLQVLITLPNQISRQERVLDFFEVRSSDHIYNIPACYEDDNNPSDDINEGENQKKRIRQPPNYLPVTSCFEPDEAVDNETYSYQTLLEDITSLDLYEDYDILYEFPLKNLVKLRNVCNDSTTQSSPHFYEDELWLKECEEILSPYSPNKAYFRIVQELDFL